MPTDPDMHGQGNASSVGKQVLRDISRSHFFHPDKTVMSAAYVEGVVKRFVEQFRDERRLLVFLERLVMFSIQITFVRVTQVGQIIRTTWEQKQQKNVRFCKGNRE